jgi:hypothetical protein
MKRPHGQDIRSGTRKKPFGEGKSNKAGFRNDFQTTSAYDEQNVSRGGPSSRRIWQPVFRNNLMKLLFYRIVVLVAGLALFLDGLALVDFLLHPLAGDFVYDSALFRAVSILVLVPLTLLVGFLIIRRVPGNVVGPLLIAWSGSVAYFSIRADIPPVVWGLFYAYDKLFGWPAFFLMLLHFPSGQIFPPRMAVWVYGAALVNLVFSGLVLLSTDARYGAAQLPNPFYNPVMQPAAGMITAVWLGTVLIILLETLASLAFRFKDGTPVERQQIRWLALFGDITVMYAIIGLVIFPLLEGRLVLDPGTDRLGMFNNLITSLFPLAAIGVSVLRYHLWDLDHIIRRTLVYTILTLALTVLYFACVVSLQTIFLFFFQPGVGSAAIVLSTLATVVAFSPLRRRIQREIDRRFFRQKYDAEQAISGFSAIARSEVIVEPLAAALVSSIEETLHPEAVSLWLVSTPVKKGS